MFKLNSVLSVLLLTTLTTPLWDGYAIASPRTQQDKRAPAKNRDTSPKPSPDRRLTWGKLMRLILRQTPPVLASPGGSRGNSERIYLVAPGLATGLKEVYHERPLLVWQGWQGKISAVEVGLPGSGDRILSQPLPGTDRTIAYVGAKLQPGQTYYWSLIDQVGQPIILDRCGQKPFYQVSFKVIDGPKRDQITAKLAVLETNLKAKGATAEAIALERANYFADQQLWADALLETYSVKRPSDSLAEAIKGILASSCGSTTTKASSP